MKHPEREEWVPFLYGEGKPADQHRLETHLQNCPECRQEIESWQRSLRRLDEWTLPHSPRPVTFAPWVQWAAAAMLVLSLGVGIGRLSTRSVDPERVRASIEPELRRQIRQELAQTVRAEVDRASAATLAASSARVDNLFANFAQALESRRSQDGQAISDALGRLQSQYAADFLALKKDVDTVAVNADAGFQQTEQQLVQLAGYTRPANPQ